MAGSHGLPPRCGPKKMSVSLPVLIERRADKGIVYVDSGSGDVVG